MMKAAQNCLTADSVASWETMPIPILQRGLMQRCRYPRAQAHVRSAVVKMAYPAFQNQLQVALIERN